MNGKYRSDPPTSLANEIDVISNECEIVWLVCCALVDIAVWGLAEGTSEH